MEFRQLKYMLMVAEEKSFTKAAQKLFIAQPSLSQFIQKLERTMGTPLFDRSTTPLSLTFAGEVFAQTARQLLESKRQLQIQMQEIIDYKIGRLTIGMSPTLSSIILPQILPVFCAKFPGIQIVINEGPLEKLNILALKGETDLTMGFLPQDLPYLSYEPISTDNIVLVASKNHFLNSTPPGTKIHLADLKEEPFILLNPGRTMRRMADRLFADAGFRPKIILECENPMTTFSLAAKGIGLTFSTASIAQYSIISDHALFFETDIPIAPRILSIAYREDRHLLKVAVEFIALAKELLFK